MHLLDVGSPFETTAQHLQRHRRQVQAGAVGTTCARCCFAEHEASLRKLSVYGHATSRLNWLDERPGYMGGSWGLGCSLCAWHARMKVQGSIKAVGTAAQKGQPRRRPPRRYNPKAPRGSKWCKHSWSPGKTLLTAQRSKAAVGARAASSLRPSLVVPWAMKKCLMHGIRQHASTDGHREALRAWQATQDSTGRGAFKPGSADTSCNPVETDPQQLGQAAHRCDVICTPCPHSPKEVLKESACRNAALGASSNATLLLNGGNAGSELEAAAVQAFRGRVPQLEEWRDAWAESRNQIAFRKQARVAGLKQSRQAVGGKTKLRKMVRVMAEVARKKIRKTLREATCITLVRSTTDDDQDDDH